MSVIRSSTKNMSKKYKAHVYNPEKFGKVVDYVTTHGVLVDTDREPVAHGKPIGYLTHLNGVRIIPWWKLVIICIKSIFKHDSTRE